MSQPKNVPAETLETLFNKIRDIKFDDKSIVDDNPFDFPLADSLEKSLKTLADIWKNDLNMDELEPWSESDLKKFLDNWRGEGVEGVTEGKGLRFQIVSTLQKEIQAIQNLAVDHAEKVQEDLRKQLAVIANKFLMKIEAVEKKVEALLKQKSQPKPSQPKP